MNSTVQQVSVGWVLALTLRIQATLVYILLWIGFE